MKENNNIPYEKLKEIEERYRRIVEDSPDAIVIVCEGRVVFANKKFTEMLGYTVDDLINKNPIENIHPEDRERAIKTQRAILSGESLPSPREYRVINKNGEIIEVEINSGKIIFEGKPAIQSIFRDISERRRREKELKEMEERYRGIVENSPDTIGVVCEGRLVFVNKKGLEIFGDVIGREVIETVFPEDREKVLSDIKAVISGEVLLPREYRLVNKEGEVMEAEITRSRIEYGGKPAIQSIVRDISERKKKEREVNELEERYRSLVESSPTGILVLYDGKLVFANKNLADICGYTIDELIGKTPLELISPEDRERLVKNVNMILSGESLPSPREYKILKKNGEIVEVEVTSGRIVYGGKPAIQSIIRDISERKKRDGEIKKYIRELEILNNMAVDRELRMIELKKEINKLLGEMGREKKYKIEE
ncbi:MAG: PAS domain S-box protein [Nitrospinae bacterium]|nr:PAS domain S-box protein [Nitrospinota bacterium]